MGNSIQEQATQAISSTSRLTQEGTIQSYQDLKDQSAFLADVAKENQERQQAIAKYMSSGAEQNKQQGQTFMMSGGIKTGVGMGFIAMGAAMMAIPFAGPSAGLSMMAKGAAQVAQGAIDKNQGKKLLGMAEQALEEATKHNIMGKQEAKVAQKEVSRSRVFESKIQVLRQMLQELGTENENLSEKQLQELKAKFTQNFDKFMEDGAKALLNNGVMEVDGLQDKDGKKLGTQFFIKEGDDYFMLEVPRDENGDPIKGAQGEPLVKVDRENGHLGTKVEDGDLKDLLDVKFRFVDELKKMSSGLSTTEFDANGNAKMVPYDLTNRAHLEEFVDLIFKTNINDIANGVAPAPLHYSEDNGIPGLQKGQYDLDPNSPNFGRFTPTGVFESFGDIGGGSNPRGNGIESYQLAIQRSTNALTELGLNQGGTIYNYVGPQQDHSNSSTSQTSNNNTSGRSSDAFAQFKNSINSSVTLSQARGLISQSTDILGGSAADALPNGQA